MFSVKEIQRQLGHKRYQLIWHMMYKLRNIMGKEIIFMNYVARWNLKTDFTLHQFPKKKKMHC